MADTSPEGIAKILAALRGEHRTLINIHAAKTIEALTAERDALRAAQFRQNRLHELNAEALAEIKATVDGKSEQSVKDIIYGLLDEINNPTTPDETAV